MSKRYTIEEYTREIFVEEYLARFHSPTEVWGYCRACSNYGKQWGCPPFDVDVVALLSKYTKLRLFATKITLHDRSISQGEIDDLLRLERVRLEENLLALEREYGGLASTYIGECLHCAKGSCARLCGKSCRHPEVVRPSLEAFGFDVSKTLAELFDIELKWGSATSPAEYIVLVCGLFYDKSC